MDLDRVTMKAKSDLLVWLWMSLWIGAALYGVQGVLCEVRDDGEATDWAFVIVIGGWAVVVVMGAVVWTMGEWVIDRVREHYRVRGQ